MCSDESDVDQTEWGVLDLRDEAVAIPLDVEDDSIIGQEVCASERCAELRRSGPFGPFSDREPQAKWAFGVLVLGPEGNKRSSIEDAQGVVDSIPRSHLGSKALPCPQLAVPKAGLTRAGQGPRRLRGASAQEYDRWRRPTMGAVKTFRVTPNVSYCDCTSACGKAPVELAQEFPSNTHALS